MEFQKHVKVRQEKFGAVVFETLREKIFVTNESGAQILSLLQAGKEPEAVTNELSSMYDGDPAVIKKDVDEVISTLQESGIIKN
tara:strand:+ start:969 stop:1220 length:252 start_codon:yes stop_codon:yes gene_type:complete